MFFLRQAAENGEVIKNLKLDQEEQGLRGFFWEAVKKKEGSTRKK